MQGFPDMMYGAKKQRSPSPMDVGMALQAQNPMAGGMGGGMPGGSMDPMMGGEMMPPGGDPMMGGMGTPMGGPVPAPAGVPPMPGGDPMMGGGMAPGMASAMPPAQGLMGTYDPISEHSAASTKAALDNGLRAAMARHKGSEPSVLRQGVKEHLMALGIPPVELQMMESTGVLGGA